MGLDQYWLKTKKEINQDVDFKVDDEDVEELHYHRKVPALQEFMAKIYHKKGGSNESFNCATVKITKDELDSLRVACKFKDMDEDASGFFWGKHCNEDYEDILNAVWKAYRAIDEGYTVYYTAWY